MSRHFVREYTTNIIPFRDFIRVAIHRLHSYSNKHSSYIVDRAADLRRRGEQEMIDRVTAPLKRIVSLVSPSVHV